MTTGMEVEEEDAEAPKFSVLLWAPPKGPGRLPTRRLGGSAGGRAQSNGAGRLLTRLRGGGTGGVWVTAGMEAEEEDAEEPTFFV